MKNTKAAWNKRRRKGIKTKKGHLAQGRMRLSERLFLDKPNAEVAMRTLNVAVGIAVAALLILQVKHAQGCSVPESEVPASNFDLVEMADAVLLAEAVKQEERSLVLLPEPGVARTYVQGIPGCVRFKALDTLKGNPPKTFCLAGRTAESTGIEASWSRPRKGALSGACVAFDYSVGHKYLLFIRSEGDEHVVLSPPFARVNEEVSGEDDPWVVGVKKYIEVSQLSSYAEKDIALERILSNTAADSELHKDVNRFIRYPWPGKSVKALLAYLSPGTEPRVMRRALYLLAHKDPSESREVVEKLLNSPQAEQITSPLAEYAVNHKLPEYWQRLSHVVISSDSMPEWHFQNLLAENLKHVTNGQAIAIALKCRRPTCERSYMLSKKLAPILNSFIGGNYAAHAEESLLLAELGDRAIVKWAERAVAQGSSPSVGIAMRILARSPSGEERKFLADAFCNHREHLNDVLVGYRHADWWGRRGRAADLAATPGLNASERKALLDLLRYWTSAEEGGETRSVAYVLLENLEKREPPDKFFFREAKPLVCKR